MRKASRMQVPPSTNNDSTSEPSAGAKPSFRRSLLALALVVFGVFYLMLAMGGASFVHECKTIVCGQLHQAVFAALGALSLFAGAYRLFEGRSSVAKIIFFGTLPILVVHVLLVMTDPNEAIFFPLSTTPPPLISGLLLLVGAKKR